MGASPPHSQFVWFPPASPLLPFLGGRAIPLPHSQFGGNFQFRLPSLQVYFPPLFTVWGVHTGPLPNSQFEEGFPLFHSQFGKGFPLPHSQFGGGWGVPVQPLLLCSQFWSLSPSLGAPFLSPIPSPWRGMGCPPHPTVGAQWGLSGVPRACVARGCPHPAQMGMWHPTGSYWGRMGDTYGC